MEREEMNSFLGMTEKEMDDRAAEYESDTWDAAHLGKPKAGRPLAFAEPMKTISFKEPLSKYEEIERRCAELQMARSDYLRRLVDRDLALA